MTDGQMKIEQAGIARDLADLCLESRACAVKLKHLLHAHHCGPDAEAIIQRIEVATQKIARRVSEVGAESSFDDRERTRDPWMAVSC